MWQEDFEDVDHVEHGGPGLIDHVEADGPGPGRGNQNGTVELLIGKGLQLVDVGVEDSIHEANARALVGVLVGQFDVDFPEAALKWCCASR